MPITASAKKRKVLDGLQGKHGRPNKKFRKQRNYHSSSDEASDDEPTDFKAVNLADSDDDQPSVPVKKTKKEAPKTTTEKSTRSIGMAKNTKKHASDDEDEDDHDVSSGSEADSLDEDSDAGSDASLSASTTGNRAVSKRNDPSAFSTSIVKILSTKLPTSARADPVLSRSKIVAQKSTEAAEEKLDQKARAKLRAEKKEELDRGRVRDVMGFERGEAGSVLDEEKRLRKTAQRGVVKLFNAVRAAQVRGEEAVKEERKKGTVGIGEREKAVNEVSKQGFLDLISGKKGKPLNIEEA
ncbi:hypothetical protein FE257_012727 [Aspergillus nanangensis]|uniref:DUF1665 domain protein n=1 Tax=Aspergillus nanangensis TaxID=2582783 RepID=A0AAD4CFM7_ASPNN|nr:hypothetical protein FE257_012727 [Aspergillus nanangensis]